MIVAYFVIAEAFVRKENLTSLVPRVLVRNIWDKIDKGQPARRYYLESRAVVRVFISFSRLL
jgi:hypothetical protein